MNVPPEKRREFVRLLNDVQDGIVLLGGDERKVVAACFAEAPDELLPSLNEYVEVHATRAYEASIRVTGRSSDDTIDTEEELVQAYHWMVAVRTGWLRFVNATRHVYGDGPSLSEIIADLRE